MPTTRPGGRTQEYSPLRAGRRRQTTQDRILTASLELFNTRGHSSVTTNFIAEYLKISPGNLYYHFRNKEQIMDAIYRDMVVAVKRSAARDTEEMTASRLAQYYFEAMEILWGYRAIFGDLEEFLRRGSLADQHREFVAWGNSWWLALFESLAAEGRLGVHPPGRDVLKVVATNSILVVTGWWRHLRTSFPPSEITMESVRLGARQAFALIEPYLEPNYAADVLAAMATTIQDRNDKIE